MLDQPLFALFYFVVVVVLVVIVVVFIFFLPLFVGDVSSQLDSELLVRRYSTQLVVAI